MIEATPFSIAFVAFYVFQSLADFWLERINLGYMERHGDLIPEVFEGFIDSDKLRIIRSYTMAKNHLAICQGMFVDAVLLVYILSGLMVFLEKVLQGWDLHFALGGCLFFLLPGLLIYAASLPFDYHRTFVIEERFGFNRSTVALWAADQLKAVLLSFSVFAGILASVLWLIGNSPNYWWLWAFMLVFLVQLLLTVLYPKFIAPLFNKFEPIRDGYLAGRIKGLMERNGFRVKSILQMNAGLRSRHTNAYFTGLGKTKQIVLFDTLIESHCEEEIQAILAHELGHFVRKHILKQLLIASGGLLFGFYTTSLLLDWPLLYSSFGFAGTQAYAGLFIIAILWQKVGFFVQPVLATLSRSFELDADDFAASAMKDPQPLATALKRTAADNLSNLFPHPLYVWFNYSHPPLIERIQRLQNPEFPAFSGYGSLKCKQESRTC